MSVTDRTTSRTRMSPLRKTALAAGVIYLLTFVSIPTLALYSPLRDPDYILGPGSDPLVRVGVILEIIVALACIGTAVVLHPVLKRQNEAVSLGFVGARIREAASIYASVACLLTIVTLHRSGAPLSFSGGDCTGCPKSSAPLSLMPSGATVRDAADAHGTSRRGGL